MFKHKLLEQDGRKWYTTTANNIAFSLYVKLNCNVTKVENITITIAQIIVNIIERTYKIKLGIKSPNDIVLNNKKIGGILTQTKISGKTVKDMVVGIGMNTNQEIFPEEIKNIATSIKNEFNIEVNSTDFITQFCNEFEKIVNTL